MPSSGAVPWLAVKIAVIWGFTSLPPCFQVSFHDWLSKTVVIRVLMSLPSCIYEYHLSKYFRLSGFVPSNKHLSWNSIRTFMPFKEFPVLHLLRSSSTSPFHIVTSLEGCSQRLQTFKSVSSKYSWRIVVITRFLSVNHFHSNHWVSMSLYFLSFLFCAYST